MRQCEIEHCKCEAIGSVTVKVARADAKERVRWKLCGHHITQINTVLLSTTPTTILREMTSSDDSDEAWDRIVGGT